MIKIQRKIQFHNDCGALVNYEELEKAVLWYAPHPVASNKHIYKYGEYPAVSIGKQKVHIHRLLMMYWCGYIFPSDIYVHHIDENKQNNSIYNLELINHKTHSHNHKIVEINFNKPRKKVGQYTLDGKLIKIWESIKETERNGFSQVGRCCKNIYKQHARCYSTSKRYSRKYNN